MVNTFLVHTNFYQSAKKLDRSRLGKQRVEAKQILTSLNQLRFLADYFHIQQYPVGKDTLKTDRENWIHTIINTFKQSGLIAIHIGSRLIVDIHSPEHLPIKPKSQHQLVESNGIVYEVKGKRQAVISQGLLHQYVLPGEELIKNLKIHPAITMWLGFETALKAYINAHIKAWVERGYQNTMVTYKIPESFPRPNWTRSEEVIGNFKSTLVERELLRKEPFWYCLQLDMVSEFVFDKSRFEQFKVIINSLPSLIYNDRGKLVEPDIYYDIKNQLYQLGEFPGFIWP